MDPHDEGQAPLLADPVLAELGDVEPSYLVQVPYDLDHTNGGGAAFSCIIA